MIITNKSQIHILIACEESQTICKAFRERGFSAFSCDLKKPSGGFPEWHYQDDALKIIRNGGGQLLKGGEYYTPSLKWDLIIAHPPCQYLSDAGRRWCVNNPERVKKMHEAAEFFMKFVNADCEFIAIENPKGFMSSYYRKEDQYVHPYHFGDEFSKRTGFWLKNLPKLRPTNVVGRGEFKETKNGRKLNKWLLWDVSTSNPERRAELRSKFFPGMAKAIATQWGDFVYKKLKERR